MIQKLLYHVEYEIYLIRMIMDCKNEGDNLDDREINDDDFNSVDDLLSLIYLEKKVKPISS
jgi:hypothetical protein